MVRDTRAASVVADVMAGHRPTIWVSDLYGAQQGHADLWQVCLAHQLRDCQYAIDAGDTIFAPRMKALLRRAVVLARRRTTLAESTRRSYLRKLDRSLNAIMVLAPTNRDRRRLRKRYGAVRGSLFTFLEHPDVPPDNNGSERELRPTARLPADSGHSGAPNGSPMSAQWSVLRRVVELTPITPFATYCATRRCYNRFEQL